MNFKIKGRRENDNGAEVRLPFGITILTKSKDLIWVVAVVSLVGVLAWQHKELLDSQIILSERIGELVYVSSLSFEDRAKLNIVMPDSLRKKLRDKEDN